MSGGVHYTDMLSWWDPLNEPLHWPWCLYFMNNKVSSDVIWCLHHGSFKTSWTLPMFWGHWVHAAVCTKLSVYFLLPCELWVQVLFFFNKLWEGLNINISNEFNFSEVHGSMNPNLLLAKFTWAQKEPMSGFIHFACNPLLFIPPWTFGKWNSIF